LKFEQGTAASTLQTLLQFIAFLGIIADAEAKSFVQSSELEGINVTQPRM
jgi:hypothetical protein